MRKTKIICTLGPATEDENILRQLMVEGMNVARFNFSHGNHEQHGKTLAKLMRLREELNLPIASLLDTKGPEIRIGRFKDGRVQLNAGQQFVLSINDVTGTNEMVSVSYKNLIKDIEKGITILLDDGLIALEVMRTTSTDIICTVINDGVISDNKGVNIPGVALSMPYISPKDHDDIIFGIEHGFDFIAASFVRTADDILQIRKILQEKDCNSINIISKIENMQGVDNIDEIIRVSDGIMIARGDMGVEIPLEDVPVLQKMIIKKVCNAGKQVITATQMLDSMIKNPRPTRAEATDVANAIYDNTSAIMLSGETAAGLYPIEALKTMVKIAIKAEEDIDYRARLNYRENNHRPDVTDAISHATCTSARDLDAAAIITVTKSGRTARMISKNRPDCPIVGCSTYEHICRQLNLSWGVTPLLIEEKEDTDDLFEHAVDIALKNGLVSQGELVVITAGVPLGISGTTNIIKVHVAGHVLLTGKSISKKSATGSLLVCHCVEELEANFKQGDIVVLPYTNNEMVPQLKKASGIIVEEEGPNSHAAIVGLSLDIPVVLGAKHATKILKSGAVVRIEGESGMVCSNT